MPPLSISAKITVSFSSALELEATLIAISHEKDVQGRSKCSINYDKEKKTLIIEIDSTDAVACRASMNAYLRILQIVADVEST